MGFPFYPKHEHGCPNVSDCPHLGGAALGTLVLIANISEENTTRLHHAIDTERKRNSELLGKVVLLEELQPTGTNHLYRRFRINIGN